MCNFVTKVDSGFETLHEISLGPLHCNSKIQIFKPGSCYAHALREKKTVAQLGTLTAASGTDSGGGSLAVNLQVRLINSLKGPRTSLCWDFVIATEPFSQRLTCVARTVEL